MVPLEGGPYQSLGYCAQMHIATRAHMSVRQTPGSTWGLPPHLLYKSGGEPCAKIWAPGWNKQRGAAIIS
jgi:hypothetical protein